jgi:hypothetical protein
MYQSVAVPATYKRGGRKGTPTVQAEFLKLLHKDLIRFGRTDAQFVESGDAAIFLWSTLYNQPASPQFRQEVARVRLAANAEALKSFETAHPQLFRPVFDLDTHAIVPEIVACDDDAELNRIFDYYLFQQSIESSVNRGRFGRFLIYDRAVACRPVMGIIGLSSPVYFNGARDAALAWPATGRREGKQWFKDPRAQKRRDRGLLSLAHITAAALVPPYSDNLKLGRLLSSLCFSDDVVGFMEARYERPITALTTTGGWGGSAGSYQRIRLRRTDSESLGHLFVSLEGQTPSLNQTLAYFSEPLFRAALGIHLGESSERSSRYKEFARDKSVRDDLFIWTLGYLGLPRAATYVNRISHYLGAVSEDGIRYLRKGARGAAPAERTIPIARVLSYWRGENGRVRLTQVRQTPLSHRMESPE